MNATLPNPRPARTVKALPVQFEAARNGLAEALTELEAAQKEFGDLVNREAALEDELEAMKPTFKATNEQQVERKHKLTQQQTECRTQARAIENKTLPRCREALAAAMNQCIEPYRVQLQMEIATEKARLLRVLRDYFRDEASAIAACERTDLINYLLNHLRLAWTHSLGDPTIAKLNPRSHGPRLEWQNFNRVAISRSVARLSREPVTHSFNLSAPLAWKQRRLKHIVFRLVINEPDMYLDAARSLNMNNLRKGDPGEFRRSINEPLSQIHS